MSWQSKSVMEQKRQFIQLWLTNEYTVKGLCEAFGISRTTGYNLIEKYDQIGEEAFREESKAPLSIPHKTP
ncbi:MAG: helix-turn-helix domain-containing protein, partial [Bacteroidetes bacterium]|nr:helix-turn-helix domain-containing protein [Bacteroidota bacterium]